MAGEGTGLGNIGGVISGAQAYKRLFEGDILGALSGGIFGEGGLFGGGGHHNVSLPNVSVPKLLATRGITLPFKNLSVSRYRYLGGQSFKMQRALAKGMLILRQELRDVNIPREDLKRFNKQLIDLTLHKASSPGDLVRRANQQMSIMANTITWLDKLKGVQPPSQPPKQQPQKIDKKQIGRIALRAARGFIRLPKQELRSSAFVSKGSAGFRDISELEQDVDRIIPSGFISKQPTTQSRALALRSLS